MVPLCQQVERGFRCQRTDGRQDCAKVSIWVSVRGLVNRANVRRIFLNATNEQALNKVSMDELKQFAVDKET